MMIRLISNLFHLIPSDSRCLLASWQHLLMKLLMNTLRRRRETSKQIGFIIEFVSQDTHVSTAQPLLAAGKGHTQVCSICMTMREGVISGERSREPAFLSRATRSAEAWNEQRSRGKTCEADFFRHPCIHACLSCVRRASVQVHCILVAHQTQTQQEQATRGTNESALFQNTCRDNEDRQ